MSLITQWRFINWRIHALFLMLLLACCICFFRYNLYETNRYIVLNNNLNFREFHSIRKSNTNAQWHDIDQCSTLLERIADLDTVEIYQKFDFKASRQKHFWNKSFEKRYSKLRVNPKRPLLKVFVVPHSHNDPGWRETFDDYYEWKTKHIIRNIITNLQKYPNMTFIWSEVIFLENWWSKAHPAQKQALKKLIAEGRLEITTGGWVMPDEGCTHIYSLLDQFIEGHEWLKINLGVIPKFGWSVDPFGHGPTVPYILDESGFKGTIIQRIHYAWKRWMAEKQAENFYWVQSWSNKMPFLLVHNMPFDIYSIKSSCGPHVEVCSYFDFHQGEITDFFVTAEEITDSNIMSKSRELIEQYHRIGSLTTHNVVLVPLGDDFRYDLSSEFDNQYQNYTKLFNFINSHKEIFRAHVQFGTPSDYFRAVKKRRHYSFPTLKGDFFVYSDIFTTGKPAYWSGYFTSRPYFKKFVRQLEHQLRTSEILYTLIFNSFKSSRADSIIYKKLEIFYEKLISSRRILGLVQHHDAITGTAKERVMENYGVKLIQSYNNCIRLQETALSMAMNLHSNNHSWPDLQSDHELDSYGEAVKKQILLIPESGEKKVVLFNSLAEDRTELVQIQINSPSIILVDKYRNEIVQHQITPTIKIDDLNGAHVISESVFKLIFLAKLPALTAVTYTLSKSHKDNDFPVIACSKCISVSNSTFRKLPKGRIELENKFLLLLIDRTSGFLRKVISKKSKIEHKVEIQFAAYESAAQESGAYLFKPNPLKPENRVLERYFNKSKVDENIIIITGPILTEINVIYYPFLIHSVKIINAGEDALSHVILIENNVDFEDLPKNRETELFMRIDTDIENTNPKTEFHTDQNGFQYQKRVKVDKLGIEGNYYPITTMAWIQDNETRMTYITNHAQGASSFVPGRLEVMLDRRMIYDDERGLGEGIFDNKPTQFQSLLTFENSNPQPETKPYHKYELPSRAVTYLSRIFNYPVHVYFYDTEELKPYVEFVHNFPNDLFLLTLRTISNDMIQTLPSPSCYMVLHRPGYDCDIGPKINRGGIARFTSKFHINNIVIDNIRAVSLTGLKKFSDLSKIQEIQIEPMELKTFYLMFHKN